MKCLKAFIDQLLIYLCPFPLHYFVIEFIKKKYTQLLHAHSVYRNFIELMQQKEVNQTELFKHIRTQIICYITVFMSSYLKVFIDTLQTSNEIQ